MSRLRALAVAISLALMATALVAFSLTPAPNSFGSGILTRAQAQETQPRYQPPLRGAPVGRMGGGTRGAHDDMPRLVALVPDHTGWTISESPTLYWYLSKPSALHLEFSLIDDLAIDPLVEVRVFPADSLRIQAIRLADLGVKLTPDRHYKWFISLVPDMTQRSRDVIAGGLIARVYPSEELNTRLADASEIQKCAIYAEYGLWYDALAAISDQIEQTPDVQELLEIRWSLLEQVGIEIEHEK